MSVKIIAGIWARIYDIQGELALKDGASIADALAELPVSANEIGITSLNGKAAPRGTVLRDGDRLELFPVIIDG